MTGSVETINLLGTPTAEGAFLVCGGATRWAQAMAARRPFQNAAELFIVADDLWRDLGPDDWLEAFSRHPKIGQKPEPKKDIAGESNDAAVSKQWSSQEQSGLHRASADIVIRLAEANEEYWKRFGFIFIVCATGKTAEQMLAILEHRLQNDRAVELPVAAEELRQIMHIRLEKLLATNPK